MFILSNHVITPGIFVIVPSFVILFIFTFMLFCLSLIVIFVLFTVIDVLIYIIMYVLCGHN